MIYLMHFNKSLTKIDIKLNFVKLGFALYKIIRLFIGIEKHSNKVLVVDKNTITPL
jgi:hypothetical protein